MSVRLTVTTSSTPARLTATGPVLLGGKIPSNYGLITFTAANPTAAEIKVS